MVEPLRPYAETSDELGYRKTRAGKDSLVFRRYGCEISLYVGENPPTTPV
jgi:hypothetical protein